MNIMADELATRQCEKMTAPKTYVSTPYKHLIISDMTITRDSQQWILDTASRIPIQQYYNDKYRWSAGTFQSINWAAQQAVLSRYEMNDQRRIRPWMATNVRSTIPRKTSMPTMPLLNQNQSPSPSMPTPISMRDCPQNVPQSKN
jgi:hypothetical protein